MESNVNGTLPLNDVLTTDGGNIDPANLAASDDSGNGTLVSSIVDDSGVISELTSANCATFIVADQGAACLGEDNAIYAEGAVFSAEYSAITIDDVIDNGPVLEGNYVVSNLAPEVISTSIVANVNGWGVGGASGGTLDITADNVYGSASMPPTGL